MDMLELQQSAQKYHKHDANTWGLKKSTMYIPQKPQHSNWPQTSHETVLPRSQSALYMRTAKPQSKASTTPTNSLGRESSSLRSTRSNRSSKKEACTSRSNGYQGTETSKATRKLTRLQKRLRSPREKTPSSRDPRTNPSNPRDRSS